MYNPYQHSGPFGRPPDYPGFGAPPGTAPPGMSAPGTGPPPGMQQANGPQPGHPGFPPNFQPPANMPNINFSAPVIRLGTSGPSKSSTPLDGRDKGSDTRRGAGLGSIESQRQNIREAMLQLQPPTKDEVVRTIFIGGITEGISSDEEVERILRTAGNLRRWIRATDADEKPCKFGFAEYEDPHSLSTAIEVLRDVEVPVKRQQPPTKEGNISPECEKSKLLVVVDESSLKYIDQYKASSNYDSEAGQSRIESARGALSALLSEIQSPSAEKDTAKPVDRDGDVTMTDTNGHDTANTEVVTIPITVEDELSDIPPEMRETVAKEIAAFRERSNRRDLERLKREEEIESLEKSRPGGSRINRLSSPPLSAPTGPSGIPSGPRDRGILNAPSGPKGFGHQIPKDYHKGVSFVGGIGVNEEEEDTDASDAELERRRHAKTTTEAEKHFLDQERRWLNRERSRAAAVEREKNRDKDEEKRLEDEKQAMAKSLREWNDDVEASRKVEEYYSDRGLWIRNRAAFRNRETALDEADRSSEAREKARVVQQRERARGLADDFLARQAEELETRAQAPREPQRFKLSLGAAAQKVQASTKRRTVAEVEGLLEDEEDTNATAKRPLTAIKFDTAAEVAGLNDEERAQAARQLAAEIPLDKGGLWSWDVKWEFVDESVLGDQLKPFVEKKIMEYLGVQEQMLVDVVEEHVRKRGSPQELVEQLEGALDEEAEVLVKKLWRMIIFFSESEKRGLTG
ncbi:hypothetical protein LOZ58_004922 [Ophidiomyces ophidiicola]|nr:hypothetical protein LOZ58_004922 [Ophidiomyces ophidiicola]